jgi:possible mycodextranase
MKRRYLVGSLGAAAAIALLPSLSTTHTAVAADGDTTYGASFPYTRYEAERGRLDRAHVVSLDESLTVDKMLDSTAIEAGEQSYVELEGKGSSVSFTAEVPGNAIDLRFTLPDHRAGSVDIRINGEKAATFNLSSETAYQYVQKSKVFDEKKDKLADQGPIHARFQFDEVHTLLNRQVNPGDTVSVVRTGSEGYTYGIDFIELEQALPEIPRPDNSVSLTDDDLTVTEEVKPGEFQTRSVHAWANDGKDDSEAFLAALKRASDEKKTLYIPRGTFEFDSQLVVRHSPDDNHQLMIQGAGIWYSNLFFRNPNKASGGIVLEHTSHDLQFRDFYMSTNLKSRYDEGANYKGFQGVTKNSQFVNLWIEHFECGFWMGDYVNQKDMQYTENMLVDHSRIRNNFADGLNYSQGSRDSAVRNSNVRGNGDDGLASWSSHAQSKPGDPVQYVSNARHTDNIEFTHNTIELGWRAGGIGFFGGSGQKAENNLITGNFEGAGIRLNTVFGGHNFDWNLTLNKRVSIQRNKIVRSGTQDDYYGTSRGAIDFQEMFGRIAGVDLYDNIIVRPFAEDIRSDFAFTDKEKKLRGMSIGDNPRRDWDGYEPQHLVVNYARVNGKVDRGIPEDANYALYWWDGDRVNPVDGKTHRYWIPKADGVQINDGMEFSWEGNKKVYNVTLADNPQYLPISSTRFFDDYSYQGEMAQSFQDPNQPQRVIRFWSHR